ncbi:MAG: hypothetical protein OQK82_08490, partial [Candidatus Pacearchaeota archaeon]|nr:hypothetical protein [Candidatus Pacearchaeota archaeon]
MYDFSIKYFLLLFVALASLHYSVLSHAGNMLLESGGVIKYRSNTGDVINIENHYFDQNDPQYSYDSLESPSYVSSTSLSFIEIANNGYLTDEIRLAAS